MTDRTRARALAQQFEEAGASLGWFEVVYREAAAGSAAVPWADMRPNPNLVAWLDRSRVNGDGLRALIVGCGYGDDAEELARRGFEVTAFDISPTDIAKCRERFPNSRVAYEVADLLQPPASWQRQFHFVFEGYTLQVLPPDIRATAIVVIADFVTPGGTLLVVTRARDAADPPGQMPWPLMRDELAGFSQSLREAAFEDYLDDEQPPVRRFRAEYRNDDRMPTTSLGDKSFQVQTFVAAPRECPKSPQLTFRDGTSSDIDQLAEWNHQLIRDEGHRNRMTVPQLADRMRGWLEQDYRAIVFEATGSPVAYALIREQPDEIYLRQLFVVRERRRQGIGRQAVELLRTKLWPTNKRLTIEVLIANTAAVAFWRSVGYVDYSLMLEILPPG